MSFSSQHHSFDIHLAANYGLEEAIIIHHIQHWIRINRRKGKNLKEGKCWTFDTMEHIADNFPYLNYEKVKYAIENLVKLNVLTKNNFNKLAIDKTNWYAFVDEKMFGVDQESSNNLYERENSPSIGKIPHPGGKIPEAIPDTKEKILKKKKERETEAKASVNTRFVFKRVEMAPEEIATLITQHGEEKIKEMLERLDEYADLNPKRFKQYANHATVIRKWMREDQEKQPKKKEDKITSNANWAVKFQAKMGNICKFEALSKYAEFRGYGNAPSLVIPYTENGFKEQVLNQTRKMGLIHCWEEE